MAHNWSTACGDKTRLPWSHLSVTLTVLGHKPSDTYRCVSGCVVVAGVSSVALAIQVLSVIAASKASNEYVCPLRN
jgi:hypothetical protein